MADPTGFSGIVQKNLRSLIAQSTTFQTLTGAANPTLALDHIYYDEVKASTAFNYAIVGKDENDADTLIDSSTGPQLEHRGSLSFAFYVVRTDEAPAEDQNQLVAMRDATDAIFVEMFALRRNFFNFDSLTIGPCLHSNEDEMADQFKYMMRSARAFFHTYV